MQVYTHYHNDFQEVRLGCGPTNERVGGFTDFQKRWFCLKKTTEK